MGDPSGINHSQLYYTSTPGSCFQPYNVMSFQLPLALPTSVDEMDFQPPQITGSANNDYKLSKKSKKITKKRKKSCSLCRHHVKSKLNLHLYFILLPISLTNFSAKKFQKHFLCVQWFLDLFYSTGTILFSRPFMATDKAIGTSRILVFNGESKATDLLLFYLLAWKSFYGKSPRDNCL